MCFPNFFCDNLKIVVGINTCMLDICVSGSKLSCDRLVWMSEK